MNTGKAGSGKTLLACQVALDMFLDNFEYWKTGIFHFCVQDPDVEGLAERIVEAGGKKRMEAPRYYYPGEKPYRMIYMEDPFGNILEIYSHSYELIYSAGAY